ncbi:MAG: acyltransferase family protein [Clostridiales bacterium]|nr:acyltransferase family protein [Clostridiales bacterium]
MGEVLQSNKRIALFDNLKFVLIACVVVGHFSDVITGESSVARVAFLYIYTFHMPLFIYIFGLFHNNKNTLQKVLKYLTLYVLLSIFIFSVRSLLFDSSVSLNLFSTKAIPWFMFAVAAYELLAYLLRKINKKFLIAAAVVLALFAGYDKSIGDFLIISRIIVYFPFFLLGTITPKEKLVEINKNKINKVIGAAILAAVFILFTVFRNELYVLRPFLTGRNSYGGDFAESGILIRALCYIISAVMSWALIAVIPASHLGFITKTGQKTLQIYFWHRPILYVLEFFGFDGFCLTFTGALGNMGGLALYYAAAIAVTFICALKIFSFPTKHIMNANLLSSNNKTELQ